MRWPLVRAAILAVTATAVLLAALQLAPARRPAALAVWLLLLGAIAAQLAVRWILLAYPVAGRSPFDAALRARPPPPRPPAALEGLARLLSLSGASALYAHTQLRARLRPLAADRLAWYRGVDLDGQPRAARAALGEPAWALLRADPGQEPDRDAPGLPPAALAALVEALEGLDDR
jgi:hypothetical protein